MNKRFYFIAQFLSVTEIDVIILIITFTIATVAKNKPITLLCTTRYVCTAANLIIMNFSNLFDSH